MSQRELARLAGNHQPQISAWESGRKPIQVEQLAVLLSALGLELQLSAERRHGKKSPDAFKDVFGSGRGPDPPRERPR